MNEYYLMNKDKKLLLFEIKNENLSKQVCKEIERYVSDELLPPKFINIATWVEHRNYAKHKEHICSDHYLGKILRRKLSRSFSLFLFFLSCHSRIQS